MKLKSLCILYSNTTTAFSVSEKGLCYPLLSNDVCEDVVWYLLSLLFMRTVHSYPKDHVILTWLAQCILLILLQILIWPENGMSVYLSFLVFHQGTDDKVSRRNLSTWQCLAHWWPCSPVTGHNPATTVTTELLQTELRARSDFLAFILP